MAHSTLVGSSSAKAFIACPGRRNLIKDIPPQPAGAAAAEGTLLHEAMEHMALDETLQPMDFINDIHHITPEVIGDKLVPALDAFEDMLEQFDVQEYLVEQRVQFTGELSEAFGTIDLIAKCGDGAVLICDYKFGHYGVDVTANDQCYFAGAAAMQTPSTEKWFTRPSQPVRFVIIQPTQHPVMSTWSCTAADLTQYVGKLLDAVHASEQPDAPTNPGEHCQFCPASAVCPSKLLQATAAASLPKDMSIDLETALGLAVQLEPWIRDVKKFAHNMLEAGADIPGWKLVDKKSVGRKWINPGEITTKLKAMRSLKHEDYNNYTLKSPPQLEKVCKAKNVKFDQFQQYLFAAPSSGTTLAEDADPRPPTKVELSQQDMSEALAKLK
jgi:hypothetical protein